MKKFIILIALLLMSLPSLLFAGMTASGRPCPGGAVAAPTTIIDETWAGCTNGAEPASCTSGLTWTAEGTDIFTITQTSPPSGYDQAIYQNTSGATVYYLSTPVSITSDFVIEWYWKTNVTNTVTTYRASLAFSGTAGSFGRMGLQVGAAEKYLDYYIGGAGFVDFSPEIVVEPDTWYLFKIVYHFNGESADTWDFWVDDVEKQTGIGVWYSNTEITSIKFLHYSSSATTYAWLGRVYVYTP